MLKVISVRDLKAEAFMQPAIARTKAEAIRIFESAVKDPKSQFYSHPSDFVLFELAEWDECTGDIVPHKKPVILATASEFVEHSPAGATVFRNGSDSDNVKHFSA